MKQFILSALALVGVSASALPQAENVKEFMQYVSKHGKSYQSMEEFEMRLAMYNKKDTFIKEKMGAADVGFTLGHNHFSDFTDGELEKTFGFKEHKGARSQAKTFQSTAGATIPMHWDWRQHNAVTPVKNQAQCGSCWAFATAASLEGAHSINTGQLLSFSEQMFVSCVKGMSDYGYETENPPCCYGCNGGDADASYLYAKQNKLKLVLENDWKYTMLNSTCEYESKDQTGISILEYYDIPSNKSSLMMEAAAKQPLAVNIDASNLHSYQGGIIDEGFNCGQVLNHVVTIVGFGVRSSDNVKFWIVKNSWSSGWGENGFFRLKNTDDDTSGICGVNWKASYPTTTVQAI